LLNSFSRDADQGTLMLLRIVITMLGLLAALLGVVPVAAHSASAAQPSGVRAADSVGSIVVKVRGRTQGKRARVSITGLRGEATGTELSRRVRGRWTASGLPGGHYRVVAEPIEGRRGTSTARGKRVRLTNLAPTVIAVLKFKLQKENPPRSRPLELLTRGGADTEGHN